MCKCVDSSQYWGATLVSIDSSHKSWFSVIESQKNKGKLLEIDWPKGASIVWLQ